MTYDKMNDCFATLNDKVGYAFENTDLETFFRKLDGIQGPTLVCGVGGSSIVATFLAKVLREKKHMIATFVYPRDLRYMDLSGYDNVISVSYSGNNVGAEVMFRTDLRKYLLTGNGRNDCENIVYDMKKEASYVSISATIVPMSLLLYYYCRDMDIIREILKEEITTDSDNDFYEVMSGYETQTAGMMLESCFTESGMAACVVHDKYNYCHGRINITRNKDADLIFFRMDNELDDLLYEGLKKHYGKIITIERKYDDDVINDYYATFLSLKLIHLIALKKNVEISDMNELIDNDIYYRFDGEM